MARTFISFSSKDTEMAHRVYDALSAQGIDCWISSQNIPTGANYQEEIVRAIKSASVMVLIFSENASSSIEIPKEMALASQNNLVLMPLRIDDTLARDAFEYTLATSQWIALYNDFEKHIEDVGTTIKAITERHDNFASIVQEAVDSGEDVFRPHVKDYLIEEAKEMLLTAGQAEKIINIVLGRINNKESELEYLKLIEQVLEDRVVSFLETKMLAKRAKQLGISAPRADILLSQEKQKLGIFDATNIENIVTDVKPLIETSAPYSAEQLSVNQEVKYIANIEPLIQSFPSTIWHLNTGGRSWQDQMTFHYWTAGGGKRYKDTIYKLNIGDEVYAYLSGKGYVAHGFVIGAPTILNDYVVMSGAYKGQKLVNLPITTAGRDRLTENENITNGIHLTKQDADDYEYALAVEWVKAVGEEDAKFKTGLNISPLTGCKLKSIEILEFLKSVF